MKALWRNVHGSFKEEQAPVWPGQSEQRREGAVRARVLKGHCKDLGLDSGWDRVPELYFEQGRNMS